MKRNGLRFLKQLLIKCVKSPWQKKVFFVVFLFTPFKRLFAPLPKVHCPKFLDFQNLHRSRDALSPHYASKLEVILTEQAAWRLSHLKVTQKPPHLDELTCFGQRKIAPAILGLY